MGLWVKLSWSVTYAWTHKTQVYCSLSTKLGVVPRKIREIENYSGSVTLSPRHDPTFCEWLDAVFYFPLSSICEVKPTWCWYMKFDLVDWPWSSWHDSYLWTPWYMFYIYLWCTGESWPLSSCGIFVCGCTLKCTWMDVYMWLRIKPKVLKRLYHWVLSLPLWHTFVVIVF